MQSGYFHKVELHLILFIFLQLLM